MVEEIPTQSVVGQAPQPTAEAKEIPPELAKLYQEIDTINFELDKFQTHGKVFIRKMQVLQRHGKKIEKQIIAYHAKMEKEA